MRPIMLFILGLIVLGLANTYMPIWWCAVSGFTYGFVGWHYVRKYS